MSHVDFIDCMPATLEKQSQSLNGQPLKRDVFVNCGLLMLLNRGLLHHHGFVLVEERTSEEIGTVNTSGVSSG